MQEKMDTPLRQKLAQMESAESTALVQVFVRCDKPITDSDVAALKATGATVGSVAGDVCTVRGLPAQIKDLTLLEFVRKLELDTQNLPSIHQ